MTSDFDAPSGDSACTPVAIEALRASKHQLAGVPLSAATTLLRAIEHEPGAHRNVTLYRAALSEMVVGVGNLARSKNVPIDAPVCTLLARRSLEAFLPEEMAALLGKQRHAIEKAEDAISHELDIYAAFQTLCVIKHLEGETSPDRFALMTAAEQWAKGLRSDPSEPSMMVWPDLYDAAVAFMNAQNAQRPAHEPAND